MINTSYIHEHDFIESCMEAYEKNASDIRDIVNNFDIELAKRRDMKELNIFTESHEEYFNESVADAVTALGQKILDILVTIKEKITEFIDKITGKNKDVNEIDRRIQKIAKQDPVLAKKLEIKLSQSDFNIDTVKDLNDYYVEIDKLIDQLKKEDVDPNSIKGKFQKVKDKLEKNSNTIKTASVILGIAATTTTIALNIQKLKGTCNDVAKEAQNIAAYHTKQDAIAKETVNHLKKMQKSGNQTVVTRLGILAEITNHMSAVSQKNVGGRTRLYSKILSATADISENIAAKIDGKSKNPNAHRERGQKNLDKTIDKAKANRTRTINNKNIANNIANATESYINH